MKRASKPLSGKSFSHGQFVTREVAKSLRGDCLLDVLLGRSPACVVREAFPRASCEAISIAFWASKGRIERTDGVSGSVVGSYHYSKRTSQYLREVEASRPHVHALFASSIDPVQETRSALAAKLAENKILLRPAQHGRLRAGWCVARQWGGVGKFLLAPHEDVAQLSHPDQRGFEIQRVPPRPVVAVNVYLHADPDHGQLRLWNVLPDDKSRRRLGLERTGYPYPDETLEGLASETMSFRTGDLVAINGGLLHAVLGGKETGAPRLTLSFLLGQIDE